MQFFPTLLCLFLSIGMATAQALSSPHTKQDIEIGKDPATLKDGNLLKNPSFDTKSCTSAWTVENTMVACQAGTGTCWLNDNNSGADPAVSQTLTNLKVGTTYVVTVCWRGGDHGPTHGVSGAQNIFAIDIDQTEIKRLTTHKEYFTWMINDKPRAKGTYTPITFNATKSSHTIRFRGEVGADGDVLLGWAKVAELKAQTRPDITQRGNTWAYGYGNASRDDFTPFDRANMTIKNNVERLSHPGSFWWSIAQNKGSRSVTDDNEITYPAKNKGVLVLYPGSEKTQRTKVKYTALTAGSYSITAKWTMLDKEAKDIAVLIAKGRKGNWISLWKEGLNTYGKTKTFAQAITLKVGEIIMFEIHNNGNPQKASTQVELNVIKTD